MTPPDMGEAFLMGILAGLGVMSFYTARTVYTIIKGHRVGDVVRFFDKGAKYVH